MFTRQPDYFDSETSTGTLVRQNDELAVRFIYDGTAYFAEVPYRFSHKPGETARVIYETADPSNAKLYSVVGYWITFGELIASVVIVLILYYIAVSITSNPTPEALIEEKKKPRKPKYDV